MTFYFLKFNKIVFHEMKIKKLKKDSYKLFNAKNIPFIIQK